MAHKKFRLELLCTKIRRKKTRPEQRSDCISQWFFAEVCLGNGWPVRAKKTLEIAVQCCSWGVNMGCVAFHCFVVCRICRICPCKATLTVSCYVERCRELCWANLLSCADLCRTCWDHVGWCCRENETWYVASFALDLLIQFGLVAFIVLGMPMLGNFDPVLCLWHMSSGVGSHVGLCWYHFWLMLSRSDSSRAILGGRTMVDHVGPRQRGRWGHFLVSRKRSCLTPASPSVAIKEAL